VTLREAKERGVAAAPQVERRRVRLLWASGFFDGPLDGLAILDQREDVWFCLAEEAEDWQAAGWYRRFWVVRLSPKHLALQQRIHAAFQRYVGTHFDYDENEARDAHAVRPQSEWHHFYDKYDPKKPLPVNVDAGEVIGWFQD